MKGDVCLPERSQLARAILSYLEKYPYARDSEEHILKIWLSDQRGRYTPTLVHEVIKDLVLGGTVLEERSAGQGVLYRFNLARRQRSPA